MRDMKKLVLVGSLCVLTGLSVVACGEGDESSNAEENTSTNTTPANSDGQRSALNPSPIDVMNLQSAKGVGGEGEFGGQGSTSDVHNANAGRILFSNKLINFQKEEADQFRAAFNAGDPIFGRVYYKRPMATYETVNGGHSSTNSLGGYKVRVFSNGEEITVSGSAFEETNLKGEQKDHWTTWHYSPNGDDESMAKRWRDIVNQMKPGVNKVEFKMYAGQGQFFSEKPVAIGEFEFYKPEGYLKATADLPKDAYSGSDIEDIRKAMREQLVSRGIAKGGDSEILAVRVTQDWKEGFQNLKRFRSIRGVVLWDDKDGDGLGNFVNYSFIQWETGNGWGPLEFNAFIAGAEGQVPVKDYR